MLFDPSSFLKIFTQILLPVLAMIGAGALIQRVKAIDVRTLVSLNFYLFVPAFLFVKLYGSELSWRAIGNIALGMLLPMALLGVPLYFAARTFSRRQGDTATVVISALCFNAGNFGIPVAALAYGEIGGEIQAVIVVILNTAVFFGAYAGLSIAHSGSGQPWWGYFKLPMLYVIAAALAMREFEVAPPAWLQTALETIAQGMIPIALITLGTQLVSQARWPRWGVVATVSLLKLLVLPAITAGVCWWLGLWPSPANILILAAAAPTAINTLLLAIELKGDADTAAECVFWTTIFSVLSVTVILALLFEFA